jgi:hypothetical protein
MGFTFWGIVNVQANCVQVCDFLCFGGVSVDGSAEAGCGWSGQGYGGVVGADYGAGE